VLPARQVKLRREGKLYSPAGRQTAEACERKINKNIQKDKLEMNKISKSKKPKENRERNATKHEIKEELKINNKLSMP